MIPTILDMKVALLSHKVVFSHFHLQVGACIVNSKKKIVGIGYNGMPLGCDDDLMPWGKSSTNKLENKYMYGG